MPEAQAASCWTAAQIASTSCCHSQQCKLATQLSALQLMSDHGSAQLLQPARTCNCRRRPLRRRSNPLHKACSPCRSLCRSCRPWWLCRNRVQHNVLASAGLRSLRWRSARTAASCIGKGVSSTQTTSGHDSNWTPPVLSSAPGARCCDLRMATGTGAPKLTGPLRGAQTGAQTGWPLRTRGSNRGSDARLPAKPVQPMQPCVGRPCVAAPAGAALANGSHVDVTDRHGTGTGEPLIAWVLDGDESGHTPSRKRQGGAYPTVKINKIKRL